MVVRRPWNSVLDGFAAFDFGVETPVLSALLGTTTANDVGLLVVVLKYLFPAAE